MADIRPARPARPDDGGFTLIEVLIVVVTVAIITSALAASVTVILRNVPPTEVRADDARSVQGLVTWLPQDVDAAPPGGFNRDPAHWPCAGSPPADSYNVLTARWTERTGITYTFAASYRYERVGDEWRMRRYVCEDGGSGTMSASTPINLTSALPAWDAASPPTWVEMCITTVTAGGTCPAAQVVPASIVAPAEVHSLKLHVTRLDGVVATIDAAPKNPDQDLANDPLGSSNHPPTLSQANYVLEMYAGTTVTINLAATHHASDPDGDPISGAIDSTEPMPAGITAVASDPLFVAVTAAPGLLAGTISPWIVVIVSDNRAGWVDATITVHIIAEPNQSPVVSPSDYHLQLQAGAPAVVLPLQATHGLSDPNGDPMTVTVTSFPPDVTPVAGSPGPLDLSVSALPSAPLGATSEPIVLVVSDGKGGTATATVTVEIVAPVSNNAPTATHTNIAIDLAPGATMTLALAASHGVVDPDGDAIATTSITAPAGVTAVADGALGLTLTADASAPEGPLASPVAVVVADVHGDSVTVQVTITIVAALPPPSDCVLGTLTANPATVKKQGNSHNPHNLLTDVIVTVTYTGTCNGLTLHYDTGDTSGLGVGTGRVFPPGSPTSVVIFSKNNGGTEKWVPGTHTLTASTTSEVSPNSITTTLTVTT